MYQEVYNHCHIFDYVLKYYHAMIKQDRPYSQDYDRS